MVTASLHVVTSDARRGAETFAVDLVGSLNASGEIARLVALSPSGMGEPHDVPALGRGRRSVTALAGLRRAARDVDVVVAHGSSTLEACSLALTGTRVPFVYRTIGDPSYWVTSRWRSKGVGLMLRRAARHVVLWPTAGHHLASVHGIDLGRIDVVPNAVVADRFPPKDPEDTRRARARLGLSADGPCLAFVGALSIEKDVASLLHGLQRLDHVHLIVAGDGPERSRLEALSDTLAPGRVHFLGAIANPRDVYAAADLLVLPSLSEGMPAVVIEAALVGTATIASAVGAVPEMVDDTVTGYLVPPSRPEVLAACVTEALADSEVVGRRAQTSFARRYTMEAVLPQWTRTLQRATAGD